MPTDDLFLPQSENGFAAGPDQYNPADIIIGRIGANISAGATGSGVTGSQAWIDSVLANTPSYSFTGVIHEIIAFDRKLTDVERERVYGYLAKKYGPTLEAKLPEGMVSAHPSAQQVGATYWEIQHHPNTKNTDALPHGFEFAGIPIQNMMSIPDAFYKSSGTKQADGTVLSGDTYSNVGL